MLPIACKHLIHLVPDLRTRRVIKLIVQLIHVIRILQIRKVGIILLRKSIMLIDYLRIHPGKPVGKILWMWWILLFSTWRTRGSPGGAGKRHRRRNWWSLLSGNKVRSIDGRLLTWKRGDHRGRRIFHIRIVSPSSACAPLET